MPNVNPPGGKGDKLNPFQLNLPATLAANTGKAAESKEPVVTSPPADSGTIADTFAKPQNMDDIPDAPAAASMTPAATTPLGGNRPDPALFATVSKAQIDPPASKAATGRPTNAEHAKQLASLKPHFRQEGTEGKKLNIYRVSLAEISAPPYNVAAEEKLEAIEAYNLACGIGNNPHKHSVELVGHEKDLPENV